MLGLEPFPSHIGVSKGEVGTQRAPIPWGEQWQPQNVETGGLGGATGPVLVEKEQVFL